MPSQTKLLEELDALIRDVSNGVVRAEADRGSESFYRNAGPGAFEGLVLAGAAFIARVAGRDSEFYRAYGGYVTSAPHVGSCAHLRLVLGGLQALQRALQGGWLETLQQELRANVHVDFLEQADALLSEGYHVAAMVLIGGVLEDHLRALCSLHGVSLPDRPGLNKLNAALYKQKVYDVHTTKRIEAVGHLRNDAAHGDGQKVKPEAVAEERRFLTRFLSDHPR